MKHRKFKEVVILYLDQKRVASLLETEHHQVCVDVVGQLPVFGLGAVLDVNVQLVPKDVALDCRNVHLEMEKKHLIENIEGKILTRG